MQNRCDTPKTPVMDGRVSSSLDNRQPSHLKSFRPGYAPASGRVHGIISGPPCRVLCEATRAVALALKFSSSEKEMSHYAIYPYSPCLCRPGVWALTATSLCTRAFALTNQVSTAAPKWRKRKHGTRLQVPSVCRGFSGQTPASWLSRDNKRGLNKALDVARQTEGVSACRAASVRSRGQPVIRREKGEKIVAWRERGEYSSGSDELASLSTLTGQTYRRAQSGRHAVQPVAGKTVAVQKMN